MLTIKTDVDPLPVSQINARIMTHDFAGTLLEVVDEAADSIIIKTEDPQVRVSALRWKINTVRVSRNAIFQTDPMLAPVDTWAFMMQLY